jgi:hypothetical protein
VSRVPLADAHGFRADALRSLGERAALVVTVAILGVAAVLAVVDPDLESDALVPKDASGVVVLDVSASISADTHRRIRTTLLRLASGDGRYGLVVFSDVAYEALPPGTPALELARVARYFDAREGQLSDPSPWTAAFTGGTRISAGLALAAEVARRDRLTRPAVLLVSDLDDDPNDLPRLRRELETLDRRGVAVRVVGLNPAPEDERFFARLLAEPESLRRATLEEPSASGVRVSFPLPFVALAALLAVALAAHELWRARLRWAS